MDQGTAASWLPGLGLAQGADSFAQSEIVFDALPSRTGCERPGLGIPWGAPKRFLDAQALCAAQQRETPIAPPAPRRQLTSLIEPG